MVAQDFVGREKGKGGDEVVALIARGSSAHMHIESHFREPVEAAYHY